MEKDTSKNIQSQTIEVKEDINYPLSKQLLTSISSNFGENVKIVYKKEFRSKNNGKTRKFS